MIVYDEDGDEIDFRYAHHGLGKIYCFLTKAFDTDIAELEFKKFVNGELSERLVARSRQWIADDHSR